MNNPVCATCGHVFPWRRALGQVFGPTRAGTALWGAVCPACGADLKVPRGRMLLILAAGLFFGSQGSTVLAITELPPGAVWLARLGLIVGFYAIAVFFLLRLEPVE